MKITDAWVDDPALDGKLERPILCVQVDEMPDVTIRPSTFSDGWTVGKYGPFVKYEGPDNAGAGEFNIRFRNRFPVVVDIVLTVTSERANGLSYTFEKTEYCLPLSRARQLMRKFDDAWKYVVSDRDAQKGTILWVPNEINPACKFFVAEKGQRGEICGRHPATPIPVNGIDLAMCISHIKEHNDKHAAKRAARA